MNVAEWAGVVAAAPATIHTLWLSAKIRRETKQPTPVRHAELGRQIEAQRQHALQLWPRTWEGGRPLTQVEQIIEAGKGWIGQPLDPDGQMQQMKDDAQRLLDSYKPRQEEDQ